GFFWFDVPKSDAAQHKSLRDWIDGGGGRRVWLIGGDHYLALEATRGAIERNANVRLLPSNAAHYTSRSSAYAHGVSSPPECPGWIKLELESAPTAKPGRVHAATNLFGHVLGTEEVELSI